MEQTDLLTEHETADLRRCSTRKLQRDRAEGRGCPYVRIDGRIFYRRQDVNCFIAAHVHGLHNADMADGPTVHRRNAQRQIASGADDQTDTAPRRQKSGEIDPVEKTDVPTTGLFRARPKSTAEKVRP